MSNLIGILKFLTLTDDMNTINANQYRKPDKGVANILLDWELNHEQHISSINNWCLFCVKYKHKKFLGFEQVPLPHLISPHYLFWSIIQQSQIIEEVSIVVISVAIQANMDSRKVSIPLDNTWSYPCTTRIASCYSCLLQGVPIYKYGRVFG